MLERAWAWAEPPKSSSGIYIFPLFDKLQSVVPRYDTIGNYYGHARFITQHKKYRLLFPSTGQLNTRHKIKVLSGNVLWVTTDKFGRNYWIDFAIVPPPK